MQRGHVLPSIDSDFGIQSQSRLVPPQVIGLPRTSADGESRRNAAVIGRQVLNEGKVGVLLVAGGSGTRLGFSQPKGMYPIGPVSDRSFFHIFAGQVLALSNRHGRSIPLLVMTSEQTQEEIVNYFEVSNWFGLNPKNVFIFPQGTHPVFDAKSGQCLRDEHGVIITSADGHGGVLTALENAGLFAEMKWRGIETLFYHQVDNPLVEVCDPTFVGFHVLHNAEVSTKVVRKKSPDEKVGVVAEMDGHLRVVEYSELPSAIAFERGPNGDLLFDAANTAIHLFQLEFLERIAADPMGLPWHRVERRMPCITADSSISNHNSIAIIKFERFIFDVLPRAERAIVLEIDRSVEFAPLKNAEEDCSPMAVRKAMSDAAKTRLRESGFVVPENATVEIDSGILPDELCLHPLTQISLSDKSIIIRKGDTL